MTQDFGEYIRQGEPSRVERAQTWQMAIGLQQVDGLTPSQYLIDTAKENIEGKITLKEVQYRIDNYYRQQIVREGRAETEEADRASANISKLLSEQAFSFRPSELSLIHKQIFEGIADFNAIIGKIRDYNITKKEWVLDGESVTYSSYENITSTLEFDFGQEKRFNYKGLSKREVVEHIAKFISDIWQVHPFGEGNTRTIAVFTIKYLRSFGFDVNNTLFKNHSWYFRNALVRANYNDYSKGIFATSEYLMYFFENLLLGENHQLSNRNIHLNVGEMSEKNVGEREHAILKIMSEQNTVSAKELAQLLSITDRTIERDIKHLKELGLVERIGGGRGGYWKVKE